MIVDVVGLPAPKGSKKAITHKHTGRPIVIESAGRGLVAWVDAITGAVQRHLEQCPLPPMTGPLAIKLSFRFPPTKSDPYQYWHKVRPDADKLARGVLDALSGIAISDDAVVSKLSISKRYVIGDETSGCLIEIENLASEEAEIRETRKQRAARERQRVPAVNGQERLLA